MLGAVVGPTDPVAATAVVRRLAVPDRIVAILEGESLVNDGTALVAYKLAIGAVGAAVFSLADGLAQFVWLTLGGVLMGTLVAAVAGVARRWITLPEVEAASSKVIARVSFGAGGVVAARVRDRPCQNLRHPVEPERGGYGAMAISAGVSGGRGSAYK